MTEVIPKKKKRQFQLLEIDFQVVNIDKISTKMYIDTYQEGWRQAVSQNTLCKNTHSTEVHP